VGHATGFAVQRGSLLQIVGSHSPKSTSRKKSPPDCLFRERKEGGGCVRRRSRGEEGGRKPGIDQGATKV